MRRLRIRKVIRNIVAHCNLLSFSMRKFFLGFDVANLFLQRVDKFSLLLILKRYGASIGKDADIETGMIFHNSKDYSNLSIGNNCHIGKNCFFDLRDTISISDNVVISMQCTFITHIDMSKSELKSLYPAISSPISIGNNTYIGVQTTVLKGVVIESNSFITAKSLVNKDVKNGTMVGGIPSKTIKKIV